MLEWSCDFKPYAWVNTLLVAVAHPLPVIRQFVLSFSIQQADFTDDGSVTDFVVGDHKARITTTSSGSRREGMIHCLSVDGHPIPE